MYLASTGTYSTSPYFQIAGGITLGNSGLTIAAWFRTSSSGTWGRIIEFSNGPNSDEILVSVNPWGSGQLACVVQTTTSTPMTTDLVVNDNTWRHFAWTISSDGTWKVYINGLSYETNAGQPYPRNILRLNAWIGKSIFSTDSPFNGYIDDFRVYNSVLSDSDIYTLYSTTATGIDILSRFIIMKIQIYYYVSAELTSF